MIFLDFLCRRQLQQRPVLAAAGHHVLEEVAKELPHRYSRQVVVYRIVSVLTVPEQGVLETGVCELGHGELCFSIDFRVCKPEKYCYICNIEIFKVRDKRLTNVNTEYLSFTDGCSVFLTYRMTACAKPLQRFKLINNHSIENFDFI